MSLLASQISRLRRRAVKKGDVPESLFLEQAKQKKQIE
jgi:hypothetical protein